MNVLQRAVPVPQVEIVDRGSQPRTGHSSRGELPSDSGRGLLAPEANDVGSPLLAADNLEEERRPGVLEAPSKGSSLIRPASA